MNVREYTVGHLFCGAGLGAAGFESARPYYDDAVAGLLEARFRNVWGVDVDRDALKAYEQLARGPAYCLDLFTRNAYCAFHGKEPPAGWQEVTAANFLSWLGPEAPDVIFLSPPCIGMSRLLSKARAASAKYVAANHLGVRGLQLVLDAWGDRPPKLILLENVPGLEEGRGEGLLGQFVGLLTDRGYSVGYGSRCLGEIGGLGQRRRRFTLVARHRAQVPAHLFQPAPRGLRTVGEVLGPLPLPGDPAAGPMHGLGRHTFLTWLRLALIRPGCDWRYLRGLRVENGHLADWGIECGPWRAGTLGVTQWSDPSGTITGETAPTNGPFAVADPVVNRTGDYGSLGVQPWDDSAGTMTGTCQPGSGRYTLADPRPGAVGWHHAAYRVARWDDAAGAATAQASPSCCGAIQDLRPAWVNRFSDIYRIVPWREEAGALTTTPFPVEGGTAIADPRVFAGHNNKLRVLDRGESSQAMTAGAAPSSGLQSIADPGAAWMASAARAAWAGTKGPLGVQEWEQPAGALIASGDVQNSASAVADPRPKLNCAGTGGSLPAASDRGIWLILSAQGDWHRPITALEAGVLQGLDPADMGCTPVCRLCGGGGADIEDTSRPCPSCRGVGRAGASRMVFPGTSSTAWRRYIGNGVPVAASRVIAEVVGRCLLAAGEGVSWDLSAMPVWARPVASALAIDWPPVGGVQ